MTQPPGRPGDPQHPDPFPPPQGPPPQLPIPPPQRPFPPHGPFPQGPYPPPQGPFPPQPGPFLPYGPPPPPPRKSLLPWLILGGAVLLSALVAVLAVLFTRDDDPRPVEAAADTSSAPASSTAPSSTADRAPAGGNFPGGAQAPEPTSAFAGQFAGSDEVALGWVEAMADGDFQTAYDRSCPAVRDSAAAAAVDGDPAWELATYFFEQTLGGRGFTEGTFDGLEHDAVSGHDVASFTLMLDDGEQFLLLVYVGPDLTVCDFR